MFSKTTLSHAVLLYHSVGTQENDPDKLAINPDDFEHQMDYLFDANYDVLPLKELLETKPLRRKKRIAITFDGGYRDSLLVAKDILNSFDFSASLFIPTAPSFEDAPLNHYSQNWGILNADELILAGINFDLFTAGHSGTDLTTLDTIQRQRELTKSQQLLSTIADNVNYAMALPQHNYNQAVIDDILDAGFKHILGNQNFVYLENSPVIHRIQVTGNDAFASFVSKLHRLPDWIIKRMKKNVIENLDARE